MLENYLKKKLASFFLKSTITKKKFFKLYMFIQFWVEYEAYNSHFNDFWFFCLSKYLTTV